MDGDRAPTYYLHSDAPLYYYSFTDAWIAMAYKSLPKEQQARLDPMITGFNPADMYAVDHIRRVLRTFPGVFVKDFFDSNLKNVYIDISWDEVAKYIVATPETTRALAGLMQRFPIASCSDRMALRRQRSRST